jgi:hypothetical protein
MAKIKIKNSVTAGSTPSGLSFGEMAVNITDKKIFIGNAVEGVVTLHDQNNIVTSVNGITGPVSISTGLSWTAVTADQTMAVDTGYLANKSSGTLTLTLPTTSAVGKTLRVSGMQNTWRIAQNASQKIHFGKTTTTTGVGGYLENSNAKDAVELVCAVADLEWNVISSIGNITIV